MRTADSALSAPATGPAAVQARGWGRRHAGRRRWAVHDLDVAIAPGERVLLLGPSGAGKSTLLAALAGLVPTSDSGETAGELLIDGATAHDNRHRVGLLLQDPTSQIVMARIGDDVAFGPENHGVARAEIWARVREALAMVGLVFPLERSTATLSGGQMQRLALAGVLANRPGLLLLDEPTANLDPAGAAEIRSAVASVLTATGATMVVVEHRIEAWLPLIDRVLVLDDGGALAFDGPPSAVFARHGAALRAAGVWVPGSAPGSAPGSVPRSMPAISPDRAGWAASSTRRELVRGDGLQLRYRGSQVDAVRPSDVVLRGGAVTALVGANGSGKSSLAGMVAGLVKPTAGTAYGLDEPGRALHRRRASSLVGLVGTVFQNPEHQFLTGTVRAELELAPRRLGVPTADLRARVDLLLARLRLSDLAEANPFTLSGGQQRRLSVATALSAAAPVLVLDEPTFGQDAVTWTELVALLTGLRDEGTAMLVVSHDADFVHLVADDVHTMAAGVVSP